MQISANGYMYTQATVVLVAAFIPLAILVAKMIFPILKPPKHRPFVFVLSGILLFLIGILVVYLLSMKLQTGVLNLHSQRYGDIYANSSVEPVKFWLIVIASYAMGVISSAFGLAGFGLCFRKDYLLLDSKENIASRPSMQESKSFADEYRRSRFAFSFASLVVVLLTIFFILNCKSWGWEPSIFPIIIADVVIIYLLKVKLWKCPACGFSFEMGTKDPGSMKSSSLDSCPKCSASFK